MNLTMGSVAEHEQGIASGVTAATREVGAALGVALLASIFSANGGYASPRNFVDGLVPAMWVGAAAVALATFAMLGAPSRRRAAASAPVAQAARAGERAGPPALTWRRAGATRGVAPAQRCADADDSSAAANKDASPREGSASSSTLASPTPTAVRRKPLRRRRVRCGRRPRQWNFPG